MGTTDARTVTTPPSPASTLLDTLKPSMSRRRAGSVVFVTSSVQLGMPMNATIVSITRSKISTQTSDRLFFQRGNIVSDIWEDVQIGGQTVQLH